MNRKEKLLTFLQRHRVATREELALVLASPLHGVDYMVDKLRSTGYAIQSYRANGVAYYELD